MSRFKTLSFGVALGLLLALVISATRRAGDAGAAASENGLTVYFAPDNDAAQDAIIQHINQATKSIDVQSFHFTAAPLEQALESAKRRGVNVRMVIDPKAAAEPESLAMDLAQHGVPVWVDPNYHTAHNKIMIFDDSIVETGSYNYTEQSAGKNAENALFIADHPIIAAAYVKNFEMHLARSHPITPADLTGKHKKAED